MRARGAGSGDVTDGGLLVTESVLLAQVLAWLASTPGVMAWRSNTGAARDKRGRLVRFGAVGAADITGVLRGGRRLEIEIKSASGRVTDEQAAFGERINAMGGLYFVAWRLDEVVERVTAALRGAVT